MFREGQKLVKVSALFSYIKNLYPIYQKKKISYPI